MRFCIFSVADHYPEEPRTIRELYAQILDEIELADELQRFVREVMPNFVGSGSIVAS